MGASVDDVSALSTLGEVHGLCLQCTYTQDGKDLLRVLAMEVTTQETTIMGVLATNRTGTLKDRKIG
jgi:hypothetical protein